MSLSTQPRLRGELCLNEPMARHCSWRTGGLAERFYRPADLDDLITFLQGLPGNEPLTWIGLGSNLLVRDGGVRGTVVTTAGRLHQLTRINALYVRAEAGIYCAQLARFCSDHGLTGAEFLAGIPGTLGGALAMNAGAFGGETWNHVVQVETLDRWGTHRIREAEDFEVGYRSVRGVPGEWFVAAVLRLQAGDGTAGRRRIRELLRRRALTQPTQRPSCGSVFCNPPGDYAGRLIESAGLKGRRIGGACISNKHANFIVNLGGASASDIEALIEEVQETVHRLHGVELLCEVRIVGEPLSGGIPRGDQP